MEAREARRVRADDILGIILVEVGVSVYFVRFVRSKGAVDALFVVGKRDGVVLGKWAIITRYQCNHGTRSA